MVAGFILLKNIIGEKIMAIKNAMEIFKLLDKSNCRKCGEKTCLAFAGSVYIGNCQISECPKLSRDDISKFLNENGLRKKPEETRDEYISALIHEVVNLDFQIVAKRIGAQINNGILTIPILGKKFGISRDGTFITDLHVTHWLVIPLLEYILNCKGLPVTGNWISYREITGGKEKYALFKKRGEDVLKQLADTYTDFFDDIIHMFNGKTVEKQFESDVSVVLFPFPLVPIMICYWKP